MGNLKAKGKPIEDINKTLLKLKSKIVNKIKNINNPFEAEHELIVLNPTKDIIENETESNNLKEKSTKNIKFSGTAVVIFERNEDKNQFFRSLINF